MFIRLALLFTLLPFLELYILLEVVRMSSWTTTLTIVLLTGILGAYLARREGLRTINNIQQNLQRGISPANELIEGLLILIAGAVLITPGLLTDCFGFCLLIRPLRRILRGRLSAYFERRIHIVSSTQHAPFKQPPDYDIVDMPPDN